MRFLFFVFVVLPLVTHTFNSNFRNTSQTEAQALPIVQPDLDSDVPTFERPTTTMEPQSVGFNSVLATIISNGRVRVADSVHKLQEPEEDEEDDEVEPFVGLPPECTEALLDMCEEIFTSETAVAVCQLVVLMLSGYEDDMDDDDDWDWDWDQLKTETENMLEQEGHHVFENFDHPHPSLRSPSSVPCYHGHCHDDNCGGCMHGCDPMHHHFTHEHNHHHHHDHSHYHEHHHYYGAYPEPIPEPFVDLDNEVIFDDIQDQDSIFEDGETSGGFSGRTPLVNNPPGYRYKYMNPCYQCMHCVRHAEEEMTPDSTDEDCIRLLHDGCLDLKRPLEREVCHIALYVMEDDLIRDTCPEMRDHIPPGIVCREVCEKEWNTTTSQ